MGFFNKVKNLIGIEDVEQDEEVVEEKEQEQQPVRETVREREERREERREPIRPVPISRSTREQEPVVAERSTGSLNRLTQQMKMIVIEPQRYEDCPKLVDNLKARKPVIINLEKAESETARKIFDFLSGATYALSGNVQKVSANIFLFAPENVEVAAPTESRVGFAEAVKNPWR